MRDIEAYGRLLEELIRKMTSPEMGQFRLEVSTFRIILEREKMTVPLLADLSISETGRMTNGMTDRDESLLALQGLMGRSLDFISSLMGEELARDLLVRSMKDYLRELALHVKESPRLFRFLPPMFRGVLREMMMEGPRATDHDEVLELFQDIFGSYMQDLSAQTDLSAFKLKLNILREKHRLLRHVEVKKNNTMVFDKEQWADAPDEEVREALVDAFDSMVGLSAFLIGKEEAFEKASASLEQYFEGKEHLLKRYRVRDQILNGALSKSITTGIDELDERMHGGIPKGFSLVLNAPSGIERDLFVSRMASAGLNGGASVLMVLSKDPPRTARALLRSQGLDPERMEGEGRLRFVDWFSWRKERIIGVEKDGYAVKSSKILSNLGIAMNKALRELATTNSRVGFFHIVGPALNIFDMNQVLNFVLRLRARFKEEEMATIFILEPETVEGEQGRALLEVFDGEIVLTKKVVDGTFQRVLAVRSLSGSDFDASPLQFTVQDNRIVVQSAPAAILRPREWTVPPSTDGERRKPRLEVRREPDEPALPSIKEDNFEAVEEGAWLKELLEDDGAEVLEVEPDVRATERGGGKVISPDHGPHQRPATDAQPSPLLGPIRPVVRARTLKSVKGPEILSGASAPTSKTADATAGTGPTPALRPRVVRKALSPSVRGTLTSNPAELMDEIDIAGAQSSPQKLLLDAIETIDQLLEDSEVAPIKEAPRPSAVHPKVHRKIVRR